LQFRAGLTADWIPNAAYFRRDWSLRPAGKVWQDLVLKQWWTETMTVTNRKGECEVRGLLGSYKIDVEAGGKRKSVEAPLGRDGAKLEVSLD
jgi:endo-1,4-beta-xylanase